MDSVKINAPAHWNIESNVQRHHTLWDKLMTLADEHPRDRTLIFVISLVAQGVLFLPVPAVLMYYYNAPMEVLLITMIMFFANFIAGMGGMGMRTLVGLFTVSVLIHLAMLAIYII